MGRGFWICRKSFTSSAFLRRRGKGSGRSSRRSRRRRGPSGQPTSCLPWTPRGGREPLTMAECAKAFVVSRSTVRNIKAKYDREGLDACLFMFTELLGGWREAHARERRTKVNWEKEIDWQFTTSDARTRLRHLYPVIKTEGK